MKHGGARLSPPDIDFLLCANRRNSPRSTRYTFHAAVRRSESAEVRIVRQEGRQGGGKGDLCDGRYCRGWETRRGCSIKG